MRAGFYLGNHTYEVKEVPDRKPIDHEVKIEVAWCGLCGTDIHKFEGKNGASVVVPLELSIFVQSLNPQN